MKPWWLLGMLAAAMQGAEFETIYENSNFSLLTPLNGSGDQVLVNYNRFRATEHIQEGNWFVTAIGDIENYLGERYIESDAFQAAGAVTSDTPFATQTEPHDYGAGQLRAQLYRMYGGYADARHRVSIGLQKISMGVGRIWNPTDLFNPKNPLALEPDEVYGVFSLAYSYAVSELSQFTAVAARRADDSFKYAVRYKGYFDVADMAFNGIYADDVRMAGYEIEGELLDTGVALRSEGGWFDYRQLDRRFFQGVLGADYAFENSLSLVGEWLHSTQRLHDASSQVSWTGTTDNLMRSKDYFGISTGYEFTPLLTGSLSMIANLDDGSSFAAPVLNYSLADDTTLSAGAMLYRGSNGSEFGAYGQTSYVNIKVTF